MPVTMGMFTARLHLSPHYFGSHSTIGYAELGAGAPLTPRLRLNGHFGLSQVLARDNQAIGSRLRYDMSVGATRTLGRFELGVSFDTRGPSRTDRTGPGAMARASFAF
jgi:hypothetical protein